MKTIFSTFLAVAALAILPAQGLAQEVLELDPEVAWQHPHSKITIPTELGGLPRGSVTAFSPDYLNLGFSFRDRNRPDELSLYIYRNTNGSVPVWFEQARRGIELRDLYAGPELVYAIAPYAWPDQEGWVGLRAFYDTPNSDYASSTGLALFSVNGWYVKVRASSASRSAANLSLWVDSALRELSIPPAEIAQAEPVPVTECAQPLEFKRKSKNVKSDGASNLANALLGSLIGQAVEQGEIDAKDPQEEVTWCRDAELNPTQVAYRPNASEDSYLIALGDSGMGIWVAPDAGAALLGPASGKSRREFAVTVITEQQRLNYVSQDRLPSLKRVMELVNETRPVSASSTWGEDSAITINSDAM